MTIVFLFSVAIAMYFYKKYSVEKTYVTPEPVSTVSVDEQFPSLSDADRNEAKIKAKGIWDNTSGNRLIVI